MKITSVEKCNAIAESVERVIDALAEGYSELIPDTFTHPFQLETFNSFAKKKLKKVPFLDVYMVVENE